MTYIIVKQDYEDSEVIPVSLSHWKPKHLRFPSGLMVTCDLEPESFSGKQFNLKGSQELSHLPFSSHILIRAGKSISNSVVDTNLLYHKWVQETSLCFIFLYQTKFVSKPHLPKWWGNESFNFFSWSPHPSALKHLKKLQSPENLKKTLQHQSITVMTEILIQELVPKLTWFIHRQEAPFLSFTESQGRAMVFRFPSSYMTSKTLLAIAPGPT